MNFKEYMHLERFGTDEVEDIEFGECYIFYKIDGTNGSVWVDDGIIKARFKKERTNFRKR